MRISDWSSDVCSSDLIARRPVDAGFLDAAIDRAGERHQRGQKIGELAAHEKARNILEFGRLVILMEIAEAERSARLAAQLEARAGGKVEAGRIARRDRTAAFAIVALAQRPRAEQGDTRATRILAARGAGITALVDR